MTWDSEWETIHQGEDLGQYPSEHLIRFVRRKFPSGSRENQLRALELGCGQGAQVAFLAEDGIEVVGIDGSSTAIRKASELLQRRRLTAELIVGDVADLPFEEGSFDLIVDLECLMGCTLDSAQNVIDRCNHLLKPGGWVFSQTFSEQTTVGDSFEIIGKHTYRNVTGGPLGRKRLLRLTTREDLARLFSGYEAVEIDRARCTSSGGKFVSDEWLVAAKKLS